jgi:hypothetical protein
MALLLGIPSHTLDTVKVVIVVLCVIALAATIITTVACGRLKTEK